MQPGAKVAVIGGGLAGLAAAWKLRQAGAQVTLLEAKPYLGGRLTSHRKTGLPTDFDNGPHLLLSTYAHARRLFRCLGMSADLEFPYPGEIAFVRRDGFWGKLRSWPLPAPCNLLAGLWSFSALSWAARKRCLQTASSLMRRSLHGDLSAAEWLRSSSQEEEREIFWLPLIRAALNASPHEIPLRNLQVVLTQGFCRGFLGGRLGHANKPLGEILGQKAKIAIEQAGIEVLLRTCVLGAKMEDGRIIGLRRPDGGVLPCQAVVAALPPGALHEWIAAFADPAAVLGDYLLPVWCFRSITSLYLWADRRPLLDNYTCLPGRQVAWVFDYARLWNDRRAPLGVILAPTAQDSDHIKAIPASFPDSRLVLSDLVSALPQLARVRWSHGQMLHERRATPLRPRELWGKTLPQTTSIPNLFLAGDWLDSELPPTIEAAVRSGERTVEMLIRLI